MSLILRQAILQAKSDRDDILHRLAVGEDSKKLREALTRAEATLHRYDAQLKEEQAKATANAKPVATEKKNKDRGPREDRPAPLPDMNLSCMDCGSGFTFTGRDQSFFKKNGWDQPSRCTECRDLKKNAKPAGTNIKCMDCENDFFFTDAKASIFEEKGWELPKRCRECSDAHKTMKPITVHCEGCSKDFSFSVKSQKDFKAKNWALPKRCRNCNTKKVAPAPVPAVAVTDAV